ncbi:peptidoglycan-binding protein [Patescibacteria group bacterium]|nr:MAG: peptidoglycan-binding protein [Patescibacteria group bacterium]
MNKIISSKSAIVAGLVVAAFAFTASTVSAATFSTNLKQGSTGADVMELQKVLNMSADTQVSVSGAGAPGMETSYFGAATKAAVIKFQNKYASDVLAPVGLTSGTGFVGAATRAKLNTMGGSVTTTTTTTTTSTVPGCTSTVGFSPTTGQSCATGVTTVTPTGTGLTVASATQPANGLAIQGASRVAFTKVTLTAGSSDVVVNGITVERQGAAVNANFSGVLLLDEDGSQLDIAKTLGSTNQAIVGGTFTVKAGTSKTLTIAGNMTADNSTRAGQVAALTVVSVNTASTVSGSLPITGAMHTINGTLTIGTATGTNSSYDPGTIASKAIGTTGYKFTGVRITAGSAEDVRLKSVRFYQAGSASVGDLSNVRIYVDGTAYDTVVATDGKYYTANFGSGIVISKGLSKDIWIAGDITGSGSSGRTIDFDLQKNTDLYLTGETYGQGLIYTGTVNSTVSTATPAISGYAVTVTAGSMTSVAKANSVIAQNIAINLSNQVLGGYETDLTGEAISVQSQVFHIATSSAAIGASMVTSVSLYDENGAVVAGPVDAVVDGVSTQKVTFTDTVTYPVGKHVYTLKGKIPSSASNGAVLVVTTTPSSDWTSVTGQTTGNTITLSNGIVTMNSMTVKSAALAISLSTSPAAQTVVAGGTVTFANIQLDASASGEDVRFSSLAFTKSNVTGLSTCQLFDGSTALNTGSNVSNPATTGSETISFDSTLTVAKNTVKTLTLKCNTTSSATGSYTWTITPSSTNPTVTGVTSGSSVTATGSAATSAAQAIGTGSLVVSTSPSSPSYAIAAAGSTGNTATVIRFRAANEGVNLSRIGLKLTSTASSSASDLVQVSIWDGATQVGTATFTGTNTVATSTLATTVVLPKDTDKDLTVKVDLAQVGSGYTGTQGALVAIDFNSADTTGTQGTGSSSGTTINATGSTAASGIRLFKSFPTFALGTIGSTGVADGKLMRFAVTANANGGVGINQFKFALATTSATVTNINLFGYTDSGYSAPISGFSSGQISSANVSPTATAFTITPSAVINVPAGTTYYFEARGTVTASQTTYSVTTTLNGDSAYYPAITTYAAGGTGMASTSAIVVTAGANVVWSPNATTTSAAAHSDWTSGYGVPGLPSSGLIQTRSN